MIVVDDGFTDDTAKIVDELDFVYSFCFLRQDNQGGGSEESGRPPGQGGFTRLS